MQSASLFPTLTPVTQPPLLFTAGELAGGCGQVCITEETRAMATQLPNRLHCHGNRSELAFSRVAHLQAFPILVVCLSCHLFIHSIGGFFVFLGSQLVSENPQHWRFGFANRHICFRQLTDQDLTPAAYVNVTFCQITNAHVGSSLRYCMRL